MPVLLGYWKIRGLAQPIRLLLNYADVEFEDKYYECGPGPEYNKDCWWNEKYKLGLQFPNLPYLIDGDLKLTQTQAILRYLAKKHGLVGVTEKEQLRADMMLEELLDVHRVWIGWCYGADKSTRYADMLPFKLREYEEFLGSGKWFAGETLTHADFFVYEFLDQQRLLNVEVFNDYPQLAAFLDRFEALPTIKKYMSSDRFMKWPLNNKMAKFGGNIDQH